MPDLLVAIAIAACWGTIVLVWVAGALYNVRHARPDRIRDRSGIAAYVAAIAVCGLVVILGYDFLHGLAFDVGWAKWAGLALLAASTVFTLWARFALGTMWSVGPEVGGDHRLRTNGPYGVTRHPIYTGLLGMVIGTTLLAGGHELIAIAVVSVIVFEVKIHQEERLMTATFPGEYAAYRRRVPQIVPVLKLPHGPR